MSVSITRIAQSVWTASEAYLSLPHSSLNPMAVNHTQVYENNCLISQYLISVVLIFLVAMTKCQVNNIRMTGETVQWLRMLTSLSKDLGMIQAPA